MPPAAQGETQVQSLSREDLEKEIATYCEREPSGPMDESLEATVRRGSRKSSGHNWATLTLKQLYTKYIKSF